jgi:ATP-binding cassette subfamily B multidrug efflux pump
MFSLFERLLKPTDPPEQAVPPPGFVAFFWHFARQAKGLFAALFAAGLVVALLDSTIPVFMGRIVTLITASPPDELFAKFWPHLLAMALVLLLARPLALTTQNLIANQAISANVSNRIRWQNHWYVVRQSWAFFQNDFAGRIASRVMQTGPAIRETLVALLTSVWYILVYGTSALILLASADPVFALPVALWFLGYLLLLRVLVPRMRDRSKEVSEGRSLLTGRIVDSYTNILTVKLFARAREEDGYVRDAIDHHTGLFYRSLRLNTLFGFCLSLLNATMVTGTGALALILWTKGKIEVGTVAMALPLAWQIVNIAGWVAWQITSIFENVSNNNLTSRAGQGIDVAWVLPTAGKPSVTSESRLESRLMGAGFGVNSRNRGNTPSVTGSTWWRSCKTSGCPRSKGRTWHRRPPWGAFSRALRQAGSLAAPCS